MAMECFCKIEINMFIATYMHTLLTWLTLSYKASLQASNGKKKKETK